MAGQQNHLHYEGTLDTLFGMQKIFRRLPWQAARQKLPKSGRPKPAPKTKKFHFGPAEWFVCVATVFGGLFALLTPPYLGGDEIYHFTRAFQVAEGHFIPEKRVYGTGGDIPVSVFKSYEYINDHHDRLSYIKAAVVHFPLKSEERMFVSFPHTAVGNPLMYAPQAIAIKAGLLFNAPPVLLMELARLASLIFYIVTIYVAIRLLPYGKTAAMVIALMPGNLITAGSGSADTLTIVAMALLVASVLNLRARTQPLSLWGRMAFLGLVALVSLAKMPLQIFLLLGFLIPVRVLGGTRLNWLAFLLLAAFLALIVGGSWIYIIQATITPYGPAGVMVPDQIHFLLANPAHFLAAAAHTYFSNLSASMVQSYPFYIPPAPFSFPLWLMVVYSIFLSRFFPVAAGRHVFSPWQKWFASSLGVLFILGIAALLYISWTPVGDTVVYGIHPRYLTPLFFLLIPICAIGSQRLPSRFSKLCTYLLPIGFLLFATFLLLQGFYL